MATTASVTKTHVDPRNYRADQGFFLGLSVILTVLILTGFGQLAARGITDPIGAPLRLHTHALLLVGWLGIFCMQNWLIYRGNLAWHRMLGWLAMALVAAIIVANYVVTIAVITEGRLGPQFTPAGFTALGTADTLTFVGLIGWAVAMRRNTQWHRRLMFGATLMVAAAGFNRLLGALPYSEVLSIASQLAFVAAIAWHDRRALGHIHKATIVIAAMVLIQRSLPTLLPKLDPWVDFTNRLTG
ncbi:hypothetical protein [Aurantiacibacter gilvus]|uniref:Uncharacterized protein n=1 Tax=Aurantiacibacter gilvus TaxID=3139141 RepID=A0ABU9IAB9_9SPHN